MKKRNACGRAPLSVERLEDRVLMAVDAFLKFDGVEGEARDEPAHHRIEITSFHFGGNTIRPAQLGAPRGQVGGTTFETLEFHFTERLLSPISSKGGAEALHFTLWFDDLQPQDAPPNPTGANQQGANSPNDAFWNLLATLGASSQGVDLRSSSGGNLASGATSFNEIRFEDRKGAELLTIHLEKDQAIAVEHDERHWVGHDRTRNIDRDETKPVQHDRTETVDKNESITVGPGRTEKVDPDETITVRNNRTETVDKNETIRLGKQQKMQNAGNGNASTLTVTEVKKHQDGSTTTITTVYDANGKVVQETVTNGSMTTTIDYNAKGQVIQTTVTEVKKNRDGSTTTITTVYDKNGKVIQESVTNGSITNTIDYDSKGNVIRTTETVTSPNKIVVTVYDADGKVIKTKTTTTYRDSNGHVTAKVVLIQRSDGSTVTFTTYYDANGRVIQRSVIYVKRNEDGSTTTSTDTTSYEYDASGKLVKKRQVIVRDGSTVTITIEYDANGNVIKKTAVWVKPNADGSTTTWTSTATYEYDASGRLVRKTVVQVRKGTTTTTIYDANGQVVSKTVTEYDSQGNVIKTTTTDSATNQGPGKEAQ
jgi:YD repeat-containing protein